MQNLESKNRTPTHLADQQYRLNKALLDASEKLNLYEKQLILLAINAINKEKKLQISTNIIIFIEASEYVEVFGGDEQTAFEELKQACNDLFSKEIAYPKITDLGRSISVPTRWLSEIIFQEDESMVGIMLPPFIITTLKYLEKELSNSNCEQISFI